MRRQILITTLLTFLYLMNKAQDNSPQPYSKEVGEIVFDKKIDDPSFNTSDTLILFVKPRIEGEKPAIIKYFKEKYKSKGFENVNGYFTIRFFVNAEGKTGKFRIQTMDFSYQPKEFDQKLSDQILLLTKEFKGWQPRQFKVRKYGYYTYLNFKIINGLIKEITP